ncbi:MAG TPA: hypothetical protein VGI67_10845 [Thermoleophilaceae bacterium]
MPERWEGDERGHGEGDASRLRPGAEQLVSAMALADWVAEQPDVHLSPHLLSWLEHSDDFALDAVGSDETGAFVLRLSWQGRLGDLRGLRAAAFALLGQVAESATYVRQRRGEDRVLFEAATGMVGDDTQFAPHGHVIVLDVRGAL